MSANVVAGGTAGVVCCVAYILGYEVTAAVVGAGVGLWLCFRTAPKRTR